ncbi:MAG: PEP/pyruvate-binding domain-containing protein [Acidobacteriota bacterium]
MASISEWLHRIGLRKGKEELSALAVDTLRTTFQARYHNFKLLLSANNKALEIMAELQQARSGDRPFGMFFIRARCTAVCVSVLRMIENLDQLAPGRYTELYTPFRSIEARIRQIIQAAATPSGTDPFILPLSSLDLGKANVAGNKLANLGEIRKQLGIRVPNGFVISSRAFREFMGRELPVEIDRLMQASASDDLDRSFQLSTRIQPLIIEHEVPPELKTAIMDAFSQLEKQEGPALRVAVRSSAVGEDSSRTSHAGLYTSELNVSGDDLILAYKEVIASKYSPQAILYRLNRGIRDEDVDMCVGCIAMVNAVAGGVVYSRNPLAGSDDRISIHSAYGLPVGVVEGSAGEDLWTLSRNPLRIDEFRPGLKNEKFLSYPEEGVRRIDVSEGARMQPSIAESVALELGRVALRLEEHFGCAQDIEWALNERGEIVILQCRPLRQQGPVVLQKPRPVEIPAATIIASGGTTASPGVASGPVFIARKESDILSFPSGAVLVVQQPLPKWAAVLARASALVAEQGSTAGHLANVAREFGVPAIVGVEGATGWLEDRQIITVDADGLRVFARTIEPLLANREQPASLMEGSPVLETLKRAMECINPLTLLDPEAPEFRPSSCQTLHDITRFCHERAVLEMFSFGRSHRFSERSSKQLVCDGVSMQWWVLNLDDGFKTDVPGKFVGLDNIASIPMLALWEGIIAVPWAGPPALEPGSLVSIMLESARDPASEPSLPSPYKNRNYFMISKEFCSLASRFGYHLSSVEALVSDRAHENYVSFSFQGGAADYERRVRRVHLVVSVLDRFGFHSEVRGDSVTARIEGQNKERMIQTLRILGYLLIHTRQLDLALAHDAVSAQWKEKLLTDIAKVVDSQNQERLVHI